MGLLDTYCRMLLDTNFFRSWFGMDKYKTGPPGKGKSFTSLFKATEAASGGMYRIVMYVAVFAAFTSIVVYAAMMIMSSGARERDESKKRMERGAITIICITSSLSIVMIIFKAFVVR